MSNVFEYVNYRTFLKDFYEEQKAAKTGFTYAKFSQKAGIRSPNYLKLVLDGRKNLTPQNLIRFAKAVGLTEMESDYFEALVHFNQATKSMEKDFYQDRMNRFRQRGESTSQKTLEEYEFDSMSSWIHHAIMVMTNLSYFREDPSWIRQKLFQLISEREADDILKQLQATKFVHRNESGRLVQTFRQVKTKPEMQRLSAKMLYEGLFRRAMQSLTLSPSQEREFCASLVGISPSQVPELKRRVREFIRDLEDWALENPKPGAVYSLCFAGFPLTTSEMERRQR